MRHFGGGDCAVLKSVLDILSSERRVQLALQEARSSVGGVGREETGRGEDVVGVYAQRRLPRRQRTRGAAPKGSVEDLEAIGTVGEDPSGTDHLGHLAQIRAIAAKRQR